MVNTTGWVRRLAFARLVATVLAYGSGRLDTIDVGVDVGSVDCDQAVGRERISRFDAVAWATFGRSVSAVAVRRHGSREAYPTIGREANR